MESLTYIKNLRISPKKLRFLLPEIKKRRPHEVLPVLKYTPKKTARIFYKAIASAITNAKSTLKVADNMLKFKVLTVEEGAKQKRWKSGGRGTAKPIKRKFAHIKIILSTEESKPVVKKNELPKVENKELEQKSSKLKTQSSKLQRKTKKTKD